jgi:hypothetical protein
MDGGVNICISVILVYCTPSPNRRIKRVLGEKR